MKSPTKSSLSIVDRFLHLIESVSPSDRLLLRIAFFAVITSVIWLAFSFNSEHVQNTPIYGGSFTEGILGTPRYVNPVLAITRADQDMVALIYSGLLKISPNGTLENDIAESITISEDGLTYNIVLKDNIKFHDGNSLSAKDVAYTFRLIQDPDLKSPIRGNWVDVSIEEIGEYELNVILKEAYASFIENFTVGILPEHAWSSLPIEQLPFSQLNTEPIGSGPFSVTSAKRDTSGLINSYTLNAFRDYTPEPKISNINLSFFQNEDLLISALLDNRIDTTAYITPAKMSMIPENQFQLIEQSLPRSFGVFFNQNRSTALRDLAVREALSVSLDRDELIDKAFYGYGVPINAPTTFSNIGLKSNDNTDNTSTSSPAEKAIDILKKANWLQNDLGLWEKRIDNENITLSVTLRTSNAPLFETLSSLISQQWRAIGVDVTVEQFEQTGLVQSVIRPRDFQALLFGHDMGRSYDLYPVWHSSQQDDPGLNISQYANVSVDKLLEDARGKKSIEEGQEILREASEIIFKEKPAIFIAQPTLIYVVNNKINVQEINSIGRPSDRFSNIADWHTESDSLWPIFRNNDI